jgi:hypothetical protein
MIDHTHFSQAQITDTRTGIDQHIVIEQQRRGAQIAANPAATPEYSKFHR